jgi:tryptophanyl-tRNA synthetase
MKETVMARIVTGIKPTGVPHLGNYLGMIRPALELAAEHDAYYFVADYHALNTAPEPGQVLQRSMVIAATLLALGLDPDRTALYRQSDVPEVFELSALLATVTPKGLLNRAHAYKAHVDANERRGRGPDAGVNMGLFTYPLLMAADILGPAAEVVPVGGDQRQHLDIARDVATACNARLGPVLTLPEGRLDGRAEVVVGTDGRKMSKSYGNTIPVLAPPDVLRRAVMSIVTDSRSVEAVKDPARDTVFRLFELVAPPREVDELRGRYLAGGTGYGEAKGLLLDVLVDSFAGARERYADIVASPAEIADLLDRGARQVRRLTRTTLDQAREAIGIRPITVPMATP